MKFLIPLTSYIILVLALSCNHEDTKPRYNINSQSLRNAMTFNVGSYWAYRDINRGLVDSAFCTEYYYSRSKMFDEDASRDFIFGDYEYYEYSVNCDSFSFNYRISAKTGAIIMNIYNKSDVSTKSGIASYVMQDPLSSFSPYDQYKKLEQIESISIQGTEYYNVYVGYAEGFYHGLPISVETWYDSEFGLIKFKYIYDNQVTEYEALYVYKR